ncbi:hypothetical protein BFP70_09440 [Thioclava sp. SK-1]|uniref:flagellin n=1 Tax=Thioclava sp. SK-1 TaxID=1889770 RepID=UPI000824BC63|nr:flagellin [Thioclava sp. SK-1]OCX65283.1 hypothetical protein BFP70_09440 [Thioclava sp. SK-1]
MTYLSTGDMAQFYMLRKHNAGLKQTLNTMSNEVTTGVKSDIGAAVGGDYTQLMSINRSLTTIESFNLTTVEAALTASTMQTSFEQLQSLAEEIGPNLLTFDGVPDRVGLSTVTADAKVRLQSAISALNSSVAGRYAFSGMATDSPSVVSADELISQVQAAVGGDTTAAGIMAAVNAYFDAPAGGGGYLDTAYLGDTRARGAIQIADGETAEFTMTAQDEAIRRALKGFVVAEIAADQAGVLSLETRAELVGEAGSILTTVGVDLAAKRGELGTIENLIDDAQTRNSSEATSLKIARNELVAVDQYESATALAAAQTQLEALYTITARLSGLSLVDYI